MVSSCYKNQDYLFEMLEEFFVDETASALMQRAIDSDDITLETLAGERIWTIVL